MSQDLFVFPDPGPWIDDKDFGLALVPGQFPLIELPVPPGFDSVFIGNTPPCSPPTLDWVFVFPQNA